MNINFFKKADFRFSWKLLISLSFLLSLSIVLRVYNLGDRSLHHDESLHAMYSKYPLMGGISALYRYDPLLHGPLLYNITPLFIKLFGESNSAIRVMPLMLSLITLFLLLFAWYKTKNQSFFLIFIFISLSPTLIYWSRFLRSDPLLHFCILISVLLIYLKSRWSYLLVPVLTSLQFATKENSYLHLFILLIFIAAFALFSVIQREKVFSKFARKWSQKIYRNKNQLLVGILLSILIYALLYSSWGENPSGIIDGLFRKSLSYWFKQHQNERIEGPFFYQLLMLFWYETPLLILIVLHTLIFYFKRIKKFAYPSVLILEICLPTLFYIYYSSQHSLESSMWSSYLKIKYPLDFYPFFIAILHGLIGTVTYCRERRFGKALLFYSAAILFFSYSFVGEKVPWLSSYIVLSWILFLSLIFKDLLASNSATVKRLSYFALLLTLAINGFQAIRTNILNANDKREFIRQVHTTEIFERELLKIKQHIDKDEKTALFVDNYTTWPTSWFFYGNTNFRFGDQNDVTPSYSFLIMKKRSQLLDQKNSTFAFQVKEIPLRSWWLPNYKNMTLKKVLEYLLYRKCWNNPGAERRYLYQKIN